MAVIAGGPLNGVPFEWILLVFGIVLAGIVAALVFKGRAKGREENVQPTEQNLIALSPVDQNGNPVMGKLLANVTITDKEIVFTEPGVMDDSKEGAEKEFRATYSDVMPLPLRDQFGNLVNLWGALRMQGEIVLYSFNDLVKRVRQRFDPLETDVTEVGRHFIGGPPKISGLPALLQSTTGKVLLIGAAVGFGMFLMFFFVVVSGHWH